MFRKMIIYLFVLLAAALPIGVLAAASPQPSAQTEVLTLEHCLELASKNNKQIQVTKKRVLIAQDAVKQAEAGFWPTVSYQVAHEQSDEEQYFVGLNSSKNEGYQDTRLSGGITASVPLYTGRMLENNLKLAQIQLDSAGEDARKAGQQLTYDVKQAYYHVCLADQMLQVQQTCYDNLKHHAERVQMMYQAGTASKYDLLQAEVQRDTLKPEVIMARNQLVLAKLQLATLVGFPKDRSYTVQYDLDSLKMPVSVDLSLSSILDEAYQNRPEIPQIEQAAELNKVQTAMAEAGYKPDVALNVGYNGVNKDIAFNDWYQAWSLTLSVSGKVYDRTIKPQVDQAKDNEDLTAIKEADLWDQIRLDAEQSLQNLEVSIEKTRANQANIDLAKESLRLTEARFDAGMATTMDIMDAQLALDKNLNGYYQGVVSYLVAEAKLDLVIGKN